MNGSPDQIISPDHELLVAYLDGELDAATVQQVETRLSQDEPFRRLIRSLQEAWDLLDDLPQATLDDNFTRTTVEMVAAQAAREPVTATGRRTIRFRRIALTLLAMSCGLIGFLMVYVRGEQANRQLLRDLPVIEQVDAYANLDQVAFLEKLIDAGIFDDDFEGESKP
jgi:anti-sigma factor RsiW